jgi:hypothetical protein
MVVDGADIVGRTGESGQIIAAKVVIVVGHGIAEASDDCFRDIYSGSQYY